jgi:hypothetical protein
MSTTSTSIVDIPKRPGEADLFGIDRYSRGLVTFIRRSDTPITIAIQGEWGSGKTSLMNTLQRELCGEASTGEELRSHTGEFYSIWINTWQYSLLQSREQTLISIVSSITAQVAGIVNARHKTALDKVAKGLFGLAGKLGRGLAATAVEQVAGERAGNVMDDILSGEREAHSIKQLRDSLQEAINECLEKDHAQGDAKKGFLVFVDDLDRIDPPVAVEILELLKNIFDLHHCIFVLAIDYDVVIKGLKPKFGELTEKNEREFRSFFDKIIQMPFSMPVASYSIDQFLVNSLARIGYLSEAKARETDISRNITSICNLSVGNNPRSLKRLLNTVSLINIISRETADGDGQLGEDDHLLQLNFALICIQIAYPSLYKILCADSNFKHWDQALATQLKLRSLSEEEVAKLKGSEEFDEEWEQVLYRICERDAYLSTKVGQVSNLFNLMYKLLPEGEDLGTTLDELLALSSVTDIQAFDKPRQAINRGPVLKALARELLPRLKQRLRAPYTVVRQQSKKVQSNVFISYSPESWVDCLGVSVDAVKDHFALYVWFHPLTFKASSDSLAQDLEGAGLGAQYTALRNAYHELPAAHAGWSFQFEPLSRSRTTRGFHQPQINMVLHFNTLDELERSAFLDGVADLVTDLMDRNAQLKELSAAVQSTM